MFSSPLCFRAITKLPPDISLWQFHWLKKPLLVVLLLLTFFGLSWIIQHPRWRRRLSSPRAIVLLVGFIASLPLIYAVAASGLAVFLPTDSDAAADAIVVLGRGSELNKNRVYVAAELWRARRVPMIFVSAGGEAARITQMLEARGIPNRVLDGENCSLTTEENALFSAAILHPQGIQRILLITDSPHMMRALLTFRAYNFTVIPYTSQLPSKWGFKEKAFLNLREYIGLVNYGLRGLFLPQRSLELNSPELVNLVQKAEQYGQQRRLQ